MTNTPTLTTFKDEAEAVAWRRRFDDEPTGWFGVTLDKTVAEVWRDIGPTQVVQPLFAHPPTAIVDEGMVDRACGGYWPDHWPQHFAEADRTSIRRHMRAALSAALPAGDGTGMDGWRPIETAMKDGMTILVRDALYGKPWHYECIWNGIEWYHGFGAAWPRANPTHWMPIPPLSASSVGTGTPADIAPMFKNAPANVFMPPEFADVLSTTTPHKGDG